MRVPFRAPTRGQSRAAAEYIRLRRRVTGAFVALTFVTLFGVVGYSIVGGEQYGLIDAVYMTIITLTTVGFSEVIDLSNNPAGRVFTIALLTGGMGVVAYSVPLVAQFALEGQLNHIFSRRRMQKAIAQLEGHYVVLGNNEAALYVAEELVNTGRRTVIVVPSEDLRDEAFYRAEQALTVVADPTDDQTLIDAGVPRAKGVVVCLESDKDNVLCVLGARELAPKARIIAATEREGTQSKLQSAGADAVVNAGKIGGLRMASMLVRPTVVSFLDTMLRDERHLRVEEVTIPTDAEDRSLASFELNRVDDAMVLAVRDPAGGRFEFNPAPDVAVKPGATIIVIADPHSRKRLVEHIQKQVGGEVTLS